MSSIVYLRNKKNGTVYAYLNESEWDPETKRCRCKRKCIGHVDPDTGDIIPNRGHVVESTATVKSIGASNFLDHIAESIGLKQVLKDAMPDKADLLLSCVYYVMTNRELANIPYWSAENSTPYGKRIGVQDVADVLPSISENEMFAFYRGWRDRFADRSYYSLNTSSQSSFVSRSDYIRFNDLPDLEVDTRTHMYMVYGNESRLPLAYGYYSSSPKSLTDIRKRMNSMLWLEIPSPMHVLDREYCTEENFDTLLQSNQRFTLRAPPDFPFARDSILRVKDRIMDMKNMYTIEDETVFAMSFVNYRGGRKVFAHIIFSAEEAEKEFSTFLSLIDQCQRELITNVYVDEHRDFYQKYFIIRDNDYGRMVEENGEAIMTYNDVAGFMVILSNTLKDPEAAYRHYIQKDRVQAYYENLRNRADMRALKLYSDEAYKGRLFLQFLATIMFAEISKRMARIRLINTISFREVLQEMSDFKRISIPGCETPFYTNLNNKQLRILNAFDMAEADLRD